MSRTIEAVKCPLCGTEETSLFLTSTGSTLNSKAFHATTDTFGDFTDIWKCRHCSFVFQEHISPELEQAYVSVVDRRYLAEERGRRKTAGRILKTIERFVEPGRICDVGCFTGLLLAVARSRGWTGYGVEPSRWAAELAREQHGLTVAESTLDSIEDPKELFDVVTLIDVIEHLRDPQQALARVRRLLRSEGYLYVSTPDVSSVAARVLGRRWWGYRLEHIGYFSRQTLQRAFEQAGFRVLHAWRRGRDFSVAYWLSKLIGVSSPTAKRIAGALNRLGVDRRMIYLDFGDQIDMLGRK